VSANGASPFRAAALKHYARPTQPTVAVRRPSVAVVVVLWLLLVLALAAGAAWLTVAWRYFAT
jgi:hypothetical protein